LFWIIRRDGVLVNLKKRKYLGDSRVQFNSGKEGTIKCHNASKEKRTNKKKKEQEEEDVSEYRRFHIR